MRFFCKVYPDGSVAISTLFSSVEYAGAASGTHYPVSFPYLESADVQVGITLQGTGTVTAVSGVLTFTSAQTALKVGGRLKVGSTVYTIATRASDVSFTLVTQASWSASVFWNLGTETVLGASEFALDETNPAAPYVTTTATYAATVIVRVFRVRPLTQQWEFPEGGAFPTTELERALDHMMMVIQERYNAGNITLPGGAPVSVNGIAIAADATARAAMVPAYIGQVLVQISNNTVWIGTAGATWTQFAPTAVVASPASELKLAFVADTGSPGANQTALASWLGTNAPDYVVFGGDNSYSGGLQANFDADWLAFASWITAQKALPVLGNHDRDGPSTTGLHYTKFSYLPGNRLYWSMVLGSGLVEVFVLDSGYNSAWALPGGDATYNAVGGTQHAWFVSALAASTAKWKLVFFHHPPVSTSPEANRIANNMDWPELAKVDGVFCGHVHFAEWLTMRGIPIVNVSGSVMTNRQTDMVPLGNNANNSQLLWANDHLRAASIIRVTQKDIVVEMHSLRTGKVIYQRSLFDSSMDRTEWGQAAVGPDTTIIVGYYHVGRTPASYMVKDWFVSVAGAGDSDLSGTIYVDSVASATFTIPAGFSSTFAIPTASHLVAIGSNVQVRITTNAAYAVPWKGLQCNLRGRKLF